MVYSLEFMPRYLLHCWMTVTVFLRIKIHQHFQSHLGFTLAPGDGEKNQHHILTWSSLARDNMISPSQEGMLPVWSEPSPVNLFTCQLPSTQWVRGRPPCWFCLLGLALDKQVPKCLGLWCVYIQMTQKFFLHHVLGHTGNLRRKKCCPHWAKPAW